MLTFWIGLGCFLIGLIVGVPVGSRLELARMAMWIADKKKERAAKLIR
jgi:hypothetical protein